MISYKRLGALSGILNSILAALFFIAGIFTPARGGPFCTSSCIAYPYVSGLSQYVPNDYLWMIPPFFLGPAFAFLIACVNQRTSEEKKTFSILALAFAVVCSVLIMTDYFVQWTVVIPSILSGQTEGLTLFSQYNPHGLLVSLESLGYLIMTAAYLLVAAVISGGRLGNSIRWVSVASFSLAVGLFVSFALLHYDIGYFEVAVITIISVESILNGALLSVYFRREAQL
ncbi:MAG TPA: hypothetical protein VLX56_00890 [Nitrososphaerales archaeon]|nr:hypothetical protein [Nitrososphaerales archaeon]